MAIKWIPFLHNLFCIQQCRFREWSTYDMKVIVCVDCFCALIAGVTLTPTTVRINFYGCIDISAPSSMTGDGKKLFNRLKVSLALFALGRARVAVDGIVMEEYNINMALSISFCDSLLVQQSRMREISPLRPLVSAGCLPVHPSTGHPAQGENGDSIWWEINS
ncbi:hypothetical protein DAPPUDRAFT_94363 [Daphnia pulex]|uniref:Uncharacterized protein n=1 Tax=Daphnia pulex TaxID=6669 RepID=E9FR44_DAPPU|nr:hypothetical protein DAPPUDRAFT_94363 [Daphnia pulex]|eukprot:EFX90256.1 hypothetical protein DAPPUDRAFT_94363 [Daphnia pulex]